MLIAKPVPNQVVKDSVEIRGSVPDNDLLVFKVRYRSADSDDLLLIASDNQPQPPSILADWKTQALPDGEYQLRVMATDQLRQSKQHQVNIILDNTPPVVPLNAPQTDQKLAGNLKLPPRSATCICSNTN